MNDILFSFLTPTVFMLAVALVLLHVMARRLFRARRECGDIQRELDSYKQQFATYTEYRGRVSMIIADLQRAGSIEELTQVFTSHAAPMIGAQYGALYRVDASAGRVLQIGGYASTPASGERPSFALGEGLVGQFARDSQPVTILDIPDTALCIVSGLGQSRPKQILYQAIRQKGNTIGVLEFGTVSAFKEMARQFMEEVMPSLAMCIEILERSTRTQSLLDATRKQAEQLEQQQTALQDSSMKRDEANKALKSQVEELAGARRAMLNIMEDLEASRVLAEDATKAKGDFLANMSHEIRTPMNAIIGMSHLALQTQLDKKQRNYVEKVHRAGENLLGIINDILDFSKIEAGKMTVERIDFRLEDVMDHLANLVGIKTEDKGLELLFNTLPDVPTALVGDPLRLGQVLINLGNNAVKFTDTGEVVVNVAIAKDATGLEDGEIELHFWIKDTGIGMTPEQCSKMFQSFSQADASTTRKYGGTGLGLAISKSLVEAMHGRIWVESEAGKGSEFHFHARFGMQKEPMARRMFKADELLGIRALVVDDNASAREILSTMAKNFGLEVDVAIDGNDALRLIAAAEKKTLPYDLVLMDWKMPGMDGIETVHRLQDEHLNHTPAVIMVTAYGREEALGDAEQQGVVLKSVLTKPVTPSTLLEAIGEVLGRGVNVETRSTEKADSYSEAMAQLNGSRVLLAEDNEMNQELALELLGQAGMEVILAKNGQEAVDIFSQDSRFDGILMDCQMPVVDGYTATRTIRKLPGGDVLPIIAMTANAMAGDKEKVIEAGMVDHIAKPLNVGEMFATIAKWVKPASAKVGADKTTALQGGRAKDALFAVADGETAAKAGPTPPPTAMPTGGLPPLPGIDVKAGMATCTNKESLYLRMLLKFRDSQGQFAELFAAAQADPDPVAPTRAAHTLKGTAGNIGAKGVQAAAAALEHACQNAAPAEQVMELLTKALAELATVMDGLSKLSVGGTAPAAKAPTIDPAQLNATLNKLKHLLEESDSDAGDLLNDLLGKLQHHPLAKQLKPVEVAIEGFDFDEALKHLQGVHI